MEILICLGAAILGALGRRIAGGLLSQWTGVNIGTQPQRLLWGLTGALTVLAVGQPWFVALGTLVAIWAGSAAFGYGNPFTSISEGLLMGRTAGNPLGPVNSLQFVIDSLWMTYHGLGGTLFLAIGAWYLGLAWPVLVVAGALCAPCYALAYILKPNFPFLGLYNEPDKGLVDPPPTGELLWGAIVGVALVLACVGV